MDCYTKQQNLLKKYKDGRDLDKEDSEEVHELATIGLFHIGISLKRKKVTAKTTPLGVKLINYLIDGDVSIHIPANSIEKSYNP